jgi:hypothetical protein
MQLSMPPTAARASPRPACPALSHCRTSTRLFSKHLHAGRSFPVDARGFPSTWQSPGSWAHQASPIRACPPPSPPSCHPIAHQRSSRCYRVRAQAKRPQNRFAPTSPCVPPWLLRWLADPAKIKGPIWPLGQPDHVGLWATSGPLLGSFVFSFLFKY